MKPWKLLIQKNYESGYSFSRSVVFIWGDFPRGIAKASKSVQPPQDIITDSLYIQLENGKTKFN